MVEGAGAVGIAALLAGKVDGPRARSAVVVSGRNIDPALHRRIVGGGPGGGGPMPDADPHRGRPPRHRPARPRAPSPASRRPSRRSPPRPVVMPPILRLDIPEHRGEVDVKTAYVPGLDGFAIKISPGFFDNPRLGPAEPQRPDGAAQRQDRPASRRCCSTMAISPMCAPRPPARSRPGISPARTPPWPRSSGPACRPACSSKR